MFFSSFGTSGTSKNIWDCREELFLGWNLNSPVPTSHSSGPNLCSSGGEWGCHCTSSQQTLPTSERGGASRQSRDQIFSRVAAALGLFLLKSLCGSLPTQGQASINCQHGHLHSSQEAGLWVHSCPLSTPTPSFLDVSLRCHGLGAGDRVSMAGPALIPGLNNWLVLGLLLLSAGETVLAAKTEDLLRDPKGNTCSRIWQHPRFVAKKRGSTVEIRCHLEDMGVVSWFRKPKPDSEPKIFLPEEGRILQNHSNSEAILTILGVQFQDNGIYFCKQECTKGTSRTEHGCGTELRVMGFSTLAQLKRRNTLKDGIIMIQTLLIILFIIVPIFLLLDKDDSKAGMEEDHTYEGLDIDQTATYEDIVTLRTGEVKWSVGEHPGQE